MTKTMSLSQRTSTHWRRTVMKAHLLIATAIYFGGITGHLPLPTRKSRSLPSETPPLPPVASCRSMLIFSKKNCPTAACRVASSTPVLAATIPATPALASRKMCCLMNPTL